MTMEDWKGLFKTHPFLATALATLFGICYITPDIFGGLVTLIHGRR